MLNDDDLERYARQAIMPAIGENGQEQLLSARVLVVGAGGLGAPAIMYLAAAGIGTITIIDDDYVSRTDLNRQVIFKDSDVDLLKCRQAATAASAINPATGPRIPASEQPGACFASGMAGNTHR